MKKVTDPLPGYCVALISCTIGGGPHQCLRLRESGSEFCIPCGHTSGRRRVALSDLKKVQEVCRAYPLLAAVLVSKEVLLRLCSDVERYRVENEDLQRHGKALADALEEAKGQRHEP